MRTLQRNLALGMALLVGCVGVDEGPVASPSEVQEDEGESTGPASVTSRGQAEPGPSIRLAHAHAHAVDPAGDLEAARRTMAGLSTTDARWVEQHHRIALAIARDPALLTPADRWDAAHEGLEAAVTAPLVHDYAHADDLLLDYAALAFEAGEHDAGQEQLLALIRHHPTSPLVPQAYAVYADYLFEDGQLDDAAQLYAKLESFREPSLAAYATYRIGWCHLRHDDDGEALDSFVGAIRLSEGLDGEWGLRLRESALEDAIVAYARVGEPDEARGFFEPVARRSDIDLEPLLRRLADAYGELDDDEAAELIRGELGPERR